ncbi:2OG-Fe(II) oxygenase [Aurantibacter sp.]|uniref:2OG-Fe(II) oxygenase n=1 Tax=Aurantibacter sp. TaxID=2807103 RepID=UPI0035C8648D
MTIKEISEYIYQQLKLNKEVLSKQYFLSKPTIGYFYLDNVLPNEIALKCAELFPDKSNMRLLKSIRENKYVSAQMNKHHSILETVLYAFQDPKVVNAVNEICGLKSLQPDTSLYAGGLSLMKEKQFLNPHLDNSHDAERQLWRALNLLYYVTPNWETNNGGHLELWPNGTKKEPIVIESKFNRLVVMATHQKSWHSVSPVLLDKNRCCISNYYFSEVPLLKDDIFHVTTYKGRPEEPVKDIVLTFDAKLRMLVRKFFKKGVKKNPHIYKKDN